MTAPDASRRESAFGLVEIVVAMIVLLVLAAMVVSASSRMRYSMRAKSMETAAHEIDAAVREFDRMWPVTPSEANPAVLHDELVTRAAASGDSVDGGYAWGNNTTSEPHEGLSDDAGNFIIREWPMNPYGTEGVRVIVSATPTPCDPTTVREPGDIYVCRPPAVPAGTPRAYKYRIVAWAEDVDGNPLVKLDATRG